MVPDPLAALHELADVLEGLGLQYVIGGSLASSAWGEPRSTHDVDLIVRLSLEQIPELYRALRDSYYVDESEMRQAVRDSRAFNAIHLGLHYKIDLFVAGDTPLDRAQLEAPEPRRLGPDELREFPVTAAEVLVLRKLDWYRRGDRISDRQWRDVLGILRIQGQHLDRAKMSALAADSGLAPLLAEALRAAWGEESEPLP